MLIAKKFEVPDHCPPDCLYRDSIMMSGQNATCFRCPVLICQGGYVLVEPDDYRADWAEIWARFFYVGGEVLLPLKRLKP